MRDGRLGSVRRRWLLILSAAVLICLLMVYFGAFLVIRHRANFDYQLMLQGERPQYAGEEPVPVADGGSLLYFGFGYEVCKLKRWTGGVPPDEVEYTVGTKLEFTCRRFFPLLESFLKDRQDTKVVVAP